MSHIDEGTIHALLDGALDAERARAVDDHVRGCAQCAAAVAEARGLMAASSRILGALDDVPANVIPSIPAAAAPQPRRAKRAWRAAPWVTGIAAVLVAAVVLRTSDEAQMRGVQPGVAPVAMSEAAPDTARAEVGQATSVTANAPPPPPPPPAAAKRGVVGRVAGGGAAAADQAARTEASDRALALERREREASSRMAQAPAAAPSEPPAVAANRASDVVVDTAAERATALRRVAAPQPQPSTLINPSTVRPIDPLRDRRPDYAILAGCYRVTVESRMYATGADVAAQRAAGARDSRDARGRAAAAPTASMAEVRPVSSNLIVRLDTLAGRGGYLVRAADTDSSLGSWMAVRSDSARVELLAAGVYGLTPAMRIPCPER